MAHRQFGFDEEQNSLLIGSMLGDGELSLVNGEKARFRMIQANKEYIDYKTALFNQFIYANRGQHLGRIH